MKTLAAFIGITVGAVVFALGLNYFIVANRLAEGGLTGISLILYYVASVPVGISYLLFNIPLFILGHKLMGRDFSIRTLYGVAVSSFAIELTKSLQGPTPDLLLAGLYGGALTGLGMGIIFRYGGSTGGIDIVARLLWHSRGVEMGKTLFTIDAAVIGMSAAFFGKEVALYSLVAMFVASRVVDAVQEGAYTAKAVMIISERYEEIADRIINEMERGATVLEGKGAYTGKKRGVLYSVVARNEVAQLKRLISEVDPVAFVTVHDIREALGEGFRPLREHH
ncbi:MAG TPA: YitT family protein [Firmicutes bacterium]|nr:YitT family protein [Bacillota bacterium]